MKRRIGPLRVAHILPWPTVGGVEHATLRMARYLKSVDSVAFCLDGGGQVTRLFAENGYETAEYSGVEPSFRHPGEYIRASRSLARELRSRRIDVIHCSDLLAAYFAGLAGRLAGIPVTSHVRCQFDEISRRDRVFLRFIQRWIFVSRSTWETFGVKVPDHRGAVVHEAIDREPYVDGTATRKDVLEEFGLRPDARLIGMVARVAPIKDYDTLLRAAARVVAEDPRAHFLIVGDNSGASTYRQHQAE
ncbi:MAG: glycosyltransferase family 4 protein, partial [Gemmatimonadetes bacterium]|nr:glycosyltransferase family 4 protein [Gemmatimonadota bacterium]